MYANMCRVTQCDLSGWWLVLHRTQTHANKHNPNVVGTLKEIGGWSVQFEQGLVRHLRETWKIWYPELPMCEVNLQWTLVNSCVVLHCFVRYCTVLCRTARRCSCLHSAEWLVSIRLNGHILYNQFMHSHPAPPMLSSPYDLSRTHALGQLLVSAVKTQIQYLNTSMWYDPQSSFAPEADWEEKREYWPLFAPRTTNSNSHISSRQWGHARISFPEASTLPFHLAFWL